MEQNKRQYSNKAGKRLEIGAEFHIQAGQGPQTYSQRYKGLYQYVQRSLSNISREEALKFALQMCMGLVETFPKRLIVVTTAKCGSIKY